MNAKQALCQHAIDTLPDSTSAKRAILTGITRTLHGDDELSLKAKVLLHCLDEFDAAQKELPLSNGEGDGK